MIRDGRKSPPISPSRASIGSDGGSFALRSPTAITLPAVKPAPAYISQAAASDFATSLQRERQERREAAESPISKEPSDAIFAETGLALVNGFIDHLLYQFLATARATSLQALRPAVEQILKAKLARQAFANADEELHDLLGDDEDMEDDDNESVQSSEELRGKWDLDAVWRMTRLKVMAYTSTSDLDDDEEEQLSAEHMTPSQQRQSRHFGLVSWTSSIFLTSILEFIGEQCLAIAGRAAYERSSVKRKSKLSSPETPDGQGVIVDEFDVERIALNASLGRLWRTWRKSLRSTRSFIHSSPNSSRRPSIITNHSPQASKSGDDARNESQLDSAATAEPIQEQDAEERRERNAKIFEETQSKREAEEEAIVDRPQLSRTRSRSFGGIPTIVPSAGTDLIDALPRPPMQRKRSNSQPNPLRSNPPDVFSEGEEPVPDVPQTGEKETQEQATVGDEIVEEETKQAESDPSRSRSVTPFEGESEYAADSERPNTTISNYTNELVAEDDTEPIVEPVEEPLATEKSPEPQTIAQSASAMVVNDSAQLSKTTKKAVSRQEAENEGDMEATEAAAALNSLPPIIAKREMPVDVALASAVPGAFPPSVPDNRYEPPSQLHTVEEDQEMYDEMPESSKQTMLDGKDSSRGEHVNAISASSATVPSNPPSIYDDALQDRQSLEAQEAPATPPKDPPARESTQSHSPAVSKTPAYTGTTVTILSNSAYPREQQHAPKPMAPSPSHMKSSSRESDPESHARTVRSMKPIVTPTAEDNETMERNFEGLMASTQPKKYTLTPQNLRAIETDPNSPDEVSTAQPVVRQKSGQRFNVMAVSENQEDVTPPPPPPPKKIGPSWSVKYGKLNHHNTRPSKAGLLAREPTTQVESMREFAEFIRSTAPDTRPGPGGHTVPILVSSNANPAASAAIAASAKSSRPSLENGRGKPPARVAASPTTLASAKNGPRSNLAARDATTHHSNVNSDLIEFLNSGPPSGSSTPGMANSRTSGRNGTRSYDNLKTSNSSVDNRAGSTMTPSFHDSLNSRSPLVQQSQSSRSPMPPGGAPVRKQHRVKDPYALPSDDEDEDEDDFPMPPRKPQGGQQESLIDFLNNYDPPGSRQGPPAVSAKAQKMLGGNARAPKAAPPIAAHGSNDSSQVSLEASALPEFLRSEPQKGYGYPDSYTTTTIESLSSQKSKPKKGFWRKASS